MQCCQDAVPSIHESHNLLSGNVAVFTFVFLLLHPNLVCKTKMVYFGKLACFLYIDVGKGATISTTCWTNVRMWCRGNSEVNRGKCLDCYPVHELYNRLSCLAPTGLLVTQRRNHCFGHSTKESETGVKRSFLLCTCSFTVACADEGLVKFFSRAHPSQLCSVEPYQQHPVSMFFIAVVACGLTWTCTVGQNSIYSCAKLQLYSTEPPAYVEALHRY